MAKLPADDIDMLIAGAERKAAADAAVRARLSPRASARAGTGRIVAGLAAVAVLGYLLWRILAPAAPSAVARDLDLAIVMARDAIEAERKTSGELPLALPNASLAAVVQYERRAREYRLVSNVGGVRVTLEWDGSKKIETGEAK